MTTAFARLQFLSSDIEVLETVGSTNDYLKEKAGNPPGLPEGSVIWARNQTAGKGQQNKSWNTAPGENITLSILLKPADLLASEAFMLSKAMAFGVHSTLTQLIGQGISIKWPNDIFIGKQKIAGILIENIIQGDFVKQSVVGIGINVNQKDFLIDTNPASLAMITGETYDLKEVVLDLLENISIFYLQLQLKNYTKINSEYVRNLHHVSQEQTFLIHNLETICQIQDVLENGSIVLSIDGKKEVYLYGDAKWKI